jgi:hypothetical protein
VAEGTCVIGFTSTLLQVLSLAVMFPFASDELRQSGINITFTD